MVPRAGSASAKGRLRASRHERLTTARRPHRRRVEADVGPGAAIASDVLSRRCRRTRGASYMRGRPGSVRSLEEFGRARLSASFFMRDFLHSEIADFHGIPNIPDAPELAIAAGRELCEQLLEPLQATFGRLAIRSAYCAPGRQAFGTRPRL